MSLGERLKNLRDDKEISIQELAANTKISANKIYSFEINNEKPNIFQLDKISKYYNLSLDDLVNKEDVKDEVNRRYLVSDLSMIPFLISIFVINYDSFIPYSILFTIGFIGSLWSNHWGRLDKIVNPLGLYNPLNAKIKKHLTRGVSYILSITLLIAGIALMVINFDRLGAFGAMLLVFGMIAILASILVWDVDKYE
ncbi:helix-turn-helix domain-containing protein [Apilactobacillus timberlakei]|uniref:XRE family transcriptional regulator n=1 Tax=Apilactobacillus timberlakei TaxID=2008380 RepID=A0ABY2YVS2_9LACO|nr:helix-turn-helix transcriptional regulator [Apilactobacillus timberlakei]TPR14886.1 XRE family transcriptional regulator [Apilactobacillus timberlakei]TPR15856.1 XRE family transcriptional regulator [Apilactobacillus timberlakei]TPR16217.1 XRE family transcriptional regulator [Apilactobacillus timberlakei]